MENNKNLIAAIITAFVVSLVLACVFVAPVFQGKEIKQFDVTQFRGGGSEILDYRENGEQILWTNTMFGGMPSVLIHVHYKTSLATLLYYVSEFMPQPVPRIFLLSFCFYLMLLCLRTNPWIAIGGAVAYGLSSYFIIIIAAGHNTKTTAIAFLPLIFGGLYYAYRYNRLVGTTIYMLGLMLEITANHVQMAYYFMFLAGAFIVAELVYAFRTKLIKSFVGTSLLILLGTVLSVGVNYSKLKSINDYSKYSTRSQSELTLDSENQTTGLDRDYITGWSVSVAETFSLLIPNFKGGESAAIGSSHKEALKDVSGQMRQMVAQSNAYWGDQPGVGGPVYVGAFIVVLFVFALFYVKDRIKWAVFFASLIIVFISWGKNFSAFTNFMIDYFPMYSKFRAVSSALVIVNLTMPLLALYGLSKMATDGKMNEKAVLAGKTLSVTWLNLFLYVAGTFILFTLAIAMAPAGLTSLFATGEEDMIRSQFMDARQPDSVADAFLGALETARGAILSADAYRSLLIIGLGTALVWSFFRFKYSIYLLAGGFFLLTLSDLYLVDRRYLNDDNFVAKKSNNGAWPKTASDEYILSDPDPYYRTLNLSVSTFNDATTSFHHYSIGGYHGAKMKIYQELIQYVISDEIRSVQLALQRNPTLAGFQEAAKNTPALNMLNAKYFIFGPDGPGSVLRNPLALGNAWFPQEVIAVKNADEEITRLKTIDAQKTVLVRENNAEFLSGVIQDRDTISTVTLNSYHPEKLIYDVNANQDKIMVAGEIWHPDWKAYVDGNEVPIARVNYVLRAIKVPAGKHTVEMRFEPDFHKNEMVSLVFSVLAVLTIVILLLYPKIQERFFEKKEAFKLPE